MEVYRKHFPELIADNDEVFFQHLSGILESVDEYASMEITRAPECYLFRVVSSLPKYTMPLLEELLKFCNRYKLHIELSKSIKSSGTLCFSIKIQ